MTDTNYEGLGSLTLGSVDLSNDRGAVFDHSAQITKEILMSHLVGYVTNTIASSGATPTFDWTAYNKIVVTISTNCTISFVDPVNPCDLFVVITNGGNYTLAWPTIKWSSKTTPTMTTSGTDLVTLHWDGTSYWGVVSYDHG